MALIRNGAACSAVRHSSGNVAPSHELDVGMMLPMMEAAVVSRVESTGAEAARPPKMTMDARPWERILLLILMIL